MNAEILMWAFYALPAFSVIAFAHMLYFKLTPYESDVDSMLLMLILSIIPAVNIITVVYLLFLMRSNS